MSYSRLPKQPKTGSRLIFKILNMILKAATLILIAGIICLLASTFGKNCSTYGNPLLITEEKIIYYWHISAPPEFSFFTKSLPFSGYWWDAASKGIMGRTRIPDGDYSLSCSSVLLLYYPPFCTAWSRYLRKLWKDYRAAWWYTEVSARSCFRSASQERSAVW